MKYIQAIILAAIAVSSAANKGSEPVASPTAAEFDELYHRQLQVKTKAPTIVKQKKTKAPVGDGTPMPTDDDGFNSMSFSISSKTSKASSKAGGSVSTKAGKGGSSVSMSAESKAAKRRNLR